ncbi:MAG TPA: fumarylacetoacetase [Nocardioidaceae bacterium]|nr:fumarylacetoacetase [Nocardioidaceae bacterium]
MSWTLPPPDADFGPATLPYGVLAPDDGPPRVVTRIGDQVIDLAALASALGSDLVEVFASDSLNPLMGLGPDGWRAARAWLSAAVADESARDDLEAAARPAGSEPMLLPIAVADYVDFYASEHHASNVGQLFRPSDPSLPPNWRHLPIGYHGRAGTVVVSGTDVIRPQGQRRPDPQAPPVFGSSVRLDIECEVGFVVGAASTLGRPVTLAEAADHIFGVVLLNDWSARDIQAWEYVPLGPFLGKSFATSISAWVVPFEALDGARVPGPDQEPPVLPYLAGTSDERFGLDLRLEILVNGQVVSSPHYTDLYWSPAQMLAHMTVNGASLRVGDLFGSGTVSGADRSMFGSLLELTWNGAEPIRFADGSTRGFLEDGDIVTLRGWSPGAVGRVTLGEVNGRVVANEA